MNTQLADKLKQVERAEDNSMKQHSIELYIALHAELSSILLQSLLEEQRKTNALLGSLQPQQGAKQKESTYTAGNKSAQG